MERCARQRREQFRDCGTEEKRRFSSGLTRMDRITKVGSFRDGLDT